MTDASKKFLFTLAADDLSQVLDGLRLRAEAWTKTTDYLELGYSPDDTFICEECSDPREARQIARHYERIIVEIERQIQGQRGWV